MKSLIKQNSIIFTLAFAAWAIVAFPAFSGTDYPVLIQLVLAVVMAVAGAIVTCVAIGNHTSAKSRA